MIPAIFIFLILNFFLTLYQASCGIDIKSQIFVNLASSEIECIRFLNGTDSVGCQSNRLGNVGALIKINKTKEIQVAIDQLPFGISSIIAVIDVKNIDKDLIEILRLHENVVGILLIDQGKEKPARFSEDAACPNREFSFYKNERTADSCHEWNRKKSVHPIGLKFVDFNKPVRLITNHSDINLIIEKCLKPFNEELVADGFRCMGRMTQFMSAAGNAKICLERHTDYGEPLCDILQDQNIFAILPPLSQEDESVDQFVLASRMDTFSTFQNAKGGDLSALGSIVALLSIAHTVGQQLDTFVQRSKQSGRQLMFAFLHGESLGYIGSSRWIWDMQKGHFPGDAKNFTRRADNIHQLGVNALSFFLELQHIGVIAPLYAHTDKSVYNNNRTMIDHILSYAKKASQINFLDPNSFNYGAAPPSSYHSVLKASSRVPGLVLSSFGQSEYNYNYLNSLYDDEIRVNTERLDDYLNRIIMASNVALKAALAYVFKTDDMAVLDKFMINKDYVKQLGECFFKANWSCPFFRAITNATNDKQMDDWLELSANVLSIGGESYSFRVMPSVIKRLVFTLLVHSIGDKKSAENVRTQAQCRDLNNRQNVYKFVWMNDLDGNSSCYRTSIYLTPARSPAFEIEDYDFSSGEYSTWVASNWDGSAVFELYLKADYRLEQFAFLVALAVLLFSIPLHYAPREQWFLDNFLPPGSPQPL